MLSLNNLKNIKWGEKQSLTMNSKQSNFNTKINGEIMREGFSFRNIILPGTFLKTVFAVTFFLFCGCNDNGSLSSSNLIGYLSFLDEGCTSDHGLAKSNSEAVFGYSYFNNHLKINVSFTTLCASVFKDSVVIIGNSVNIYLANKSKYAAECICPYKETFNFIIYEGGQFKVKFNYKHIGKTEYNVLADTTICL